MLSKSYESGYRFGFNTQEKDDEIYGEGNAYTAEFWQYDARLGRRWNLDPNPQISISDYAVFANNPVWYNDVLGDSSKFFNEKGELLLTTNDALENAVVIINQDNFEAFQNNLTEALQNNIDINDDKLVKSLRGLGKSYLVEGFKNFLKKTQGDAPYGYGFEHGSYLYENNNEVRIGTEDITNNDYRHVFLPKKKNAVGDIHTHPNAGKYDSPTTGIFEHHPSKYDYDNSYDGYNIVISPKYIYFIKVDEENIKRIVVPFNNTFSKEKLDEDPWKQ